MDDRFATSGRRWTYGPRPIAPEQVVGDPLHPLVRARAGATSATRGACGPGGDDRPWAQKIVEALKTKLPLGPG